jgi:hypothetical protein
MKFFKIQQPFYALFFLLFIILNNGISIAQNLPDTQISGLYEAMIGVKDADYHIRYFAEFGFRVVDSAEISATDAQKIYGVPSKLKSYRLQNGDIDAHGLIRLLVWDKPLGNGVGYSTPETMGSRMMVMMTSDIFRLYDVFKAARTSGKEKWFPTEPIADDLFGLDGKDKNTVFKRPVYVRENAVYGEYWTHVFFQRYGYDIPGYGTINPNSPLKTSELTHHDFFIKADDMSVLRYLSEGLGMKPEKEPEIDGDWLKGPQRVFDMPAGYSHWYQGFVSPNNICGKLKFFIPLQPKPDHTANQRIGELGITLHSFYTPKLKMVYDNLIKLNIKPTAIQKNEFGEMSFVFKAPDGVSWQIIEKMSVKNPPVKKLETKLTNN